MQITVRLTLCVEVASGGGINMLLPPVCAKPDHCLTYFCVFRDGWYIKCSADREPPQGSLQSGAGGLQYFRYICTHNLSPFCMLNKLLFSNNLSICGGGYELMRKALDWKSNMMIQVCCLCGCAVSPYAHQGILIHLGMHSFKVQSAFHHRKLYWWCACKHVVSSQQSGEL